MICSHHFLLNVKKKTKFVTLWLNCYVRIRRQLLWICCIYIICDMYTAMLCSGWAIYLSIDTLRPRQNRRHFADDVLKCIFVNENVSIPIVISLKFVPKGPIDNIPALVQIMAKRRPGDEPLSETMIVRLPTHICVLGLKWDKMFPHHTRALYLWFCSTLAVTSISSKYFNYS